MRKYVRIFKIILITLVVISLSNTVLATVTAQFSGAAINTGETYGKKITEILGVVLGLVRNVGVGVAVVIMMILGCKYMLASAGERAEIKKYAVTYVIGAIVLFASGTIAGLLKSFTDSVLS